MLDGQADNEWSLRGRNFFTGIQLPKVLAPSNDVRRHYLVILPREMPRLFDVGPGFGTDERFLTDMGTVWHRNTSPLSFGNCVWGSRATQWTSGGSRKNPLQDGFVSEAAPVNRMTLVTADRRLSEVARAFCTYTFRRRPFTVRPS